MIVDIPGLVLLLICFYFIYFQIDKMLTTVKIESKIDNRLYLVNNKPDKQEAADTLATINKKLINFIDCLVKKKSQFDKTVQDAIDRLQKNFNPNNVSENVGSIEDIFSESTSYSLNKGKKIVFCVRSKPDNIVHKDYNMLMFVGLHEMAHLMSISYQHTDEFWENFKFLLKEAIDCGEYSYTPGHFKNNPTSYCGVTISSSPID